MHIVKTKMTIIAAATLALSLSACNKDEGAAIAATNSPKGAIAAPAGQKWTETTAKTEAGGFVMGNPNAPVKLIEYGSLSCPACAKFAIDSTADLHGMVDTGRVSFEYRPMMVHPQDPAIFVVARCNGPAPFFALADQLYADQESWNSKLFNLT